LGDKGARALQLRIGREFVRIGVEKRSSLARALRVGVRLLPETRRMKLALDKWIEGAEQRFPSQLEESRFEIREEEDYLIFIDRDNASSSGITSDNQCVELLWECSRRSWNGSPDILMMLKRLSAEPWDILPMYSRFQRP
jgi:hypothetical protein